MEKGDSNEILDGEKRKFEIDGEESETLYSNKDYNLPESSGDTKITLLIQNPYWVFAMWEFSPETGIKLQNSLEKSLFIRMYYADTDKFYDTEVKNGVKSWYIEIPETNRPYYAEIGILEKNGNFTALARSNAILIPSDSISPDGKPQGLQDMDLINLSGEDWIGKSPGSIK